MVRKLPDWLRLADVPMYYYHQTNTKVPTIGTVRWWIKHGKQDYNGNLVRLKHKIGKWGRYMTRRAWIDEFIERITFGGIPNETTAETLRDSENGIDLHVEPLRGLEIEIPHVKE